MVPHTPLFARVLVVCVGLALSACQTGAPKEYLTDWQAQDAPGEPSEIITLPQFPKAGRAFEVRRTYTTTRSSRANRRTPPEGYRELLKVADSEGTLEFWRDGRRVHTIKLGQCFSFAKMDKNHDFGKRGSPAYFTAPADCRVWEGRAWDQTYRTLVVGWHAPCVYEARRQATIIKDGNRSLVRAATDITMTQEKDRVTKSWSNVAEYDPDAKFFRMFDVGYVGKVEVLSEVTE